MPSTGGNSACRSISCCSRTGERYFPNLARWHFRGYMVRGELALRFKTRSSVIMRIDVGVSRKEYDSGGHSTTSSEDFCTTYISCNPVVLVSNAAEQERGPRFYADDPVCCAPKPLNIADVKARKTDTLFDFLYNSFAHRVIHATPAEGINTLGDVLDSEWFTNRHGRKRLSVEELKQGRGDGRPPRPPYRCHRGEARRNNSRVQNARLQKGRCTSLSPIR